MGMKISEVVDPKIGWSQADEEEGEFKSKMVLVVEFNSGRKRSLE